MIEWVAGECLWGEGGGRGMGGRGMLVGRGRGQGNVGQGNAGGENRSYGAGGTNGLRVSSGVGGVKGGKEKTRSGGGPGRVGVLEGGSAFAFAASGVVAGFVAAFEGVVGVGVVELLVIGHVLVLAAVVVVLTGAVGGVIDA